MEYARSGGMCCSLRLPKNTKSLNGRAKLLSEIYWKNSDEPHVSHRFAGDVGFKYRLLSNIAIHAAIGKSLRERNLGGPRLRNRHLVSYPGKHLYDALP